MELRIAAIRLYRFAKAVEKLNAETDPAAKHERENNLKSMMAELRKLDSRGK